MSKKLKTFIESIVFLIFGFTPIVSCFENKDNAMIVTLDGNDIEKRMLMGKMAQNLKALKMMIRIYGRRNGYSIEIFIK